MRQKKSGLKAERSSENPPGAPEKAPTPGADEIMNVSMLARYLRCHPSTVYRLVMRGQIPAFKIGSDWRFQKSAIERWLKKSTINPAIR